MPQNRWSWLAAWYRRARKRPPPSHARPVPTAGAAGAAFAANETRLPSSGTEGGDATIAAPEWRRGALERGSFVGPYEVVSPLGVGGMGQIFRARDRNLGRDVAIKVLPSALTHAPERLARFRREAQLLASLNHPNIATVYGLEHADDLPCLVMELIPGQTLAERVSAGALGVAEALRIGVQVADALDAAHRQGITHRDVKPANIKLTPEGRIKVLDFGLAKAAPQDSSISIEMTQPGTILGTPAYMSPEQLLAEPANEPADVWAFGCVLYELLAGRRPFAGTTFAEVVAAVLKTEPDWTALPPGLPKPVRDVLDRCLDKLAVRRAPIAEARAALEASLRSGTPLAQPHDQPVRAIAVLPFENSSGDPEMEYLGDGLAESTIFSLSQLPSLRVMARGTVFRYKGRIGNPADVGQELGVDAVLSGRVLQRGDSLVVSAELIDIARGWQLWGAQYRRPSSDLLSIEQEIAREITDALRLKLSAEDKATLARRYTRNAEAYRLYLKGRYHWGKRTADALQKGIAYFREAIEIDPTYALAYAGLAEGYVPLAFYGHLAPRDALPKARAAAQKALELDPGLAEAQTVLAMTAAFTTGDPASTERAARAAIELDPSYPRAWQVLAELYMVQGRFDDAFTQITRALELDPLSLAMHAAAGMVCYYGRQHELAAEYARKSIEMDENFFPGYWILGLALEQQGDYSGSIAALARARSLSNDSANMIANLGGAYAASGDVGAARRIIAELDELASRRYVDQALVAGIFALLGDQDEALQRLERAQEDKSRTVSRIAVDPRLDRLRSEPRFQDLVRRQGLSPT